MKKLSLILLLLFATSCASTEQGSQDVGNFQPHQEESVDDWGELDDDFGDEIDDFGDEGGGGDGGILTVYDPFESMNRRIFSFNRAMDEYVLIPVARAYKSALPEGARGRLGNMLSNFGEPVTFANSLLQGDVDHSMTTLFRFVVNSTIGLAGMHDVAGDFGLKERGEDFGQTLATYGVGDGPYLMLPFIGPSNVRDGFGSIVDGFSNPISYELDTATNIAIKAADIVHSRSLYLEVSDEIYEAFDPYASLRSVYSQHRKQKIENQK